MDALGRARLPFEFVKRLCGLGTNRRQRLAKLFELRAAVSLARLWSEQGKRAEARELLTPTYEWFIEGFNMRDLKEAKALLDELTGTFGCAANSDCPIDPRNS